jgi:hypothetical protein
MAIDSSLQALCPNTITISPWSSADGYGKPTYGAAVTHTCLLVRTPKMIRTVTGQEKVSMAQIYLTSAPGTSVKDKVTLPDGTTPVILNIDTYPSDTETSYFEVIYT